MRADCQAERPGESALASRGQPRPVGGAEARTAVLLPSVVLLLLLPPSTVLHVQLPVVGGGRLLLLALVQARLIQPVVVAQQALA